MLLLRIYLPSDLVVDVRGIVIDDLAPRYLVEGKIPFRIPRTCGPLQIVVAGMWPPVVMLLIQDRLRDPARERITDGDALLATAKTATDPALGLEHHGQNPVNFLQSASASSSTA
ncbi:MAG: hypothetical protein HUU35_15405 [Armatimonadetes bacterium]|nr:hypothetical protein [Armatimonadota bacterium]